LFIEDDMRDPWASSFLNVSKSAWDWKKKSSDIISGAKNNPRKETLLYIEDDMRVPFCSSGLNASKAAQDRKKNEVARNQGVKKIQEKKDFNWAVSGHLGLRTILLGLLTRTISAHSKTGKVGFFSKKKTGKSYASQKQKTRRFNI
jgi:hypothetical protein